MKRKASQLEPPPPATVRVVFEHLPPDSRLKLDEALQSWAAWHADRYLPGYVPPELVGGTLCYAPEAMRMLADGAAAAIEGGDVNGGAGTGAGFAWEDKPAPPAKSGADTLWFNISYEKAGDVPKYERSTDLILQHSTRKRPASEGLLAAEGAEGVGKPVKRLRGSSRCFNCGSYGHSLRECWKEHNREQVEESKREQAEAREASGAAYRSGARRYYLPGAAEGGGKRGGAEQVPGEFDGLGPGQISAELRAALGIGKLAPPPWLKRMRELGLPPGYMAPVSSVPASATEAAGAAAAAAAPAEVAGDAALSGAAAGTSDAAGPASTAGEEGLDATEDFIPLGSGSPAADMSGAAGPACTAGQDSLDALEDFIPLGEEGSPVAGAGELDGSGASNSKPDRLECVVLFPGVNAPPPEGADQQAWAPPPQQQLPALPPGFGTPQAGAGHRQGQQQQQAAASAGRSAGRSSSGGRGGWGGLTQLVGLHPPRHAASEGSLPAVHAQPRYAQHTPPQQQQQQTMHHGTSAPNLYASQQQHQLQQQPTYQPSYQQQMAAYQQKPAYHQQSAAYQPAYQQQQQQQQPPVPPGGGDGVYSVSRSDPGHLLVFDQGRAGSALPLPAAPQYTLPQLTQQQAQHQPQQPVAQQQAAARAPAQQQRGWAWGSQAAAVPQQGSQYSVQPQPEPQQGQGQEQRLNYQYQQQQPLSHSDHEQHRPYHSTPYSTPRGYVDGSGGSSGAADSWEQRQQQQQQEQEEQQRQRQQRLWGGDGRG